MPDLLYISMMRFPTEKAHGLQIAQNCEAFANAGYRVRLWVSNRRNVAAMRNIKDMHAHYGVEANFRIQRIAGVDIYPLANGNLRIERIGFYLHTWSFALFMLLRLLFTSADVYYSRDEWVLLALSLFIPKHKLAYEVHQFSPSVRGGRLQQQVVQRVGSIIAITPRLQEDFVAQRGAKDEQFLVAHDGVRAARFADLPSQQEARATVGWNTDGFIVGFVGRLHMLNKMDKGVGTLIEALIKLRVVKFGLVGGPDDSAEALRKQWLAAGLPAEHFLYAGQVAPDAVPTYLRAFDVCAMPHPFTPQFAYYTSPLKLFEYMAAARPVIASDLPGWADVIQHEHNALLIPPSDAQALAEAIQRLQADPVLCDTLGENAQQDVMQHYTWAARAKAIQAHLQRKP